MARHKSPVVNPAQALAHVKKMFKQGDLAGAERLVKKILRRAPSHAEALQFRGIIAVRRGQPVRALTIFRRLTALQPEVARHHLHHGIVLQRLGKPAEALKAYRRAIEQNPESAANYYNLGLLLQQQNHLPKAEAAYRRAIALDGSYVAAYSNLGTVLQKRQKLMDAESFYRRALALAPDDPEVHYNLGCVLGVCRKLDEAEQSYRRALAFRPNYHRALLNLGILLNEQGKQAEAEAYAQHALALVPDNIEAHALFAKCHRFQEADPELGRLQNLLERKGLSTGNRNLLLDALGKAHDDIGAYDQAFHYFRRLNEEREKVGTFDSVTYRQRVEEVKQTFSKSTLRSVSEPVDKIPIFVIGMSRSGKTLVESLLVQNPHVYAAGERLDWREAVETVVDRHRIPGEFPAYASYLGEQHFREIADLYMRKITRFSPTSRFFMNTLPGYFAYIGLIFRCLPAVKVIHCTRDALDNGLYIYFKQYQRGHEYSYNLRDLATYYKGYRDLMEHWRTLYPDAILHVDYEELVRDPASIAREIHAFCDVEFDPARLRTDLQSGEIGHWRCYEAHLRHLVDALGRG